MDAKIEQDIRTHAESEYPKESCGLIVVIKGKERYLPCANVADDPTRNFVIHHEDSAKAEDLGDILALVHSHPDATVAMSPADRVQCAGGVIPWVVVTTRVSEITGKVESGEMKRYEPDGYKAPLVGRPFVHGILDCYSLVRDYYDQELHIALPDFERKDNWWNEGQDLYMEHFAEAGCAPIKGAMKVGDIILMQVRAPKTNHAAVYIGDSTMLHHMYNRLSTREIYGGYYQEITRLVVRHKDTP
jgi:proteasome lid subunit RPN8/RPN11